MRRAGWWANEENREGRKKRAPLQTGNARRYADKWLERESLMNGCAKQCVRCHPGP